MLYITSPGLITGSVYLLTTFTYFTHPYPLPLVTTNLFLYL